MQKNWRIIVENPSLRGTQNPVAHLGSN
ncbi:hypothetical protein OESDEN_06417 [Oesophagostomum dentatum]|uniref:Uncharacterized protein n=1 Tax=Oesophagostomum dentatum TaxID=61180 RepID=A0A0B1T816_OESDE|nr:hypothetical protein OESDEN_06417 [Oesophagostomum dentatum]